MAGHGEPNSSEFMDDERSEGEEGSGQEMTGLGEPNSSEIMDEEKIHQNCETTAIEDFANQTFKRAKYSESSVLDAPLTSPTISTSYLVSGSPDSESSVLDAPLTSPTISTSSMVSECPESISSESDNQISDESLPSSPSPTKSTLSPVYELMNDEETVSADDENKKKSTDEVKQPDGPKNILNDLTYDYLPQDYTLTDLDESAQCIILDSPKEEILVNIDDVFVKQRYLVSLLDESK